mgnify:CR=1 FL=1
MQIFSRAIPDVRMLKMLLRLPRRNTDALIGAVANELASEGIELIDSTFFLKGSQLPQPGTLTKRAPDEARTERCRVRPGDRPWHCRHGPGPNDSRSRSRLRGD